MRNFMKDYKEKIECASGYDDDYVYYLVDKFIKEYIPQIIEEHIIRKDPEVSIPSRDVEIFLKDSMLKDITQGVRDGKIKGVVIPNVTNTEVSDVENESAVNTYTLGTSGITLENYFNKFNYYISKALVFISNELPFCNRNGHLEMDLFSFIEYYYFQEQRDYILRTLTPQDKELIAYTRNLFREKVMFDLIPTLIEANKNNNMKKVVIPYSVYKGVATFGSLEFPNVDLYEFGRCINLLPGKDITDYENNSHLNNQYKFEYDLQDLEELYKRALQVTESSKHTR